MPITSDAKLELFDHFERLCSIGFAVMYGLFDHIALIQSHSIQSLNYFAV